MSLPQDHLKPFYSQLMHSLKSGLSHDEIPCNWHIFDCAIYLGILLKGETMLRCWIKKLKTKIQAQPSPIF